MKIEILGVQIDSITFDQALDQIMSMVQQGGHHYVVTANPEMIVEAQKNEAFRQAINKADLIVPDGVGLLSAADYLAKQEGRHKNILLRLIDLKLSLLKILFNRKSFTALSESVSGADLVLKLAELASKTNSGFVLLGGAQGEAQGSKEYLGKQFPSLQITALTGPQNISQAQPAELEDLFGQLSVVKCQLLFVAFGHPKQELFIAQNLDRLPNGVAIGVGGTFAYLAGTKPRAPKFFRNLGLEWLWRAAIEPKRINRIITATIRFPWLVLTKGS